MCTYISVCMSAYMSAYISVCMSAYMSAHKSRNDVVRTRAIDMSVQHIFNPAEHFSFGAQVLQGVASARVNGPVDKTADAVRR